jgi:AraC family transcriptional regulator
MLAPQDVRSVRVAAVTRAIESMGARIAAPLSLADLARAGRYSPFHFHRIFREVTGVTPARFLAGLRMAEAGRLLVHSPARVAEVSHQVGYESLGTFTTQFGRVVGLAPHRFRLLMRAGRGITVGSMVSTAPIPAGYGVPPDPAGGGRGSSYTLALVGGGFWPALVVAGLCPVGSLGDRPRWWVVASGTRHVAGH